MSNCNNETNRVEPDYKGLYLTAMNKLTDIANYIEKAQLTLENMYLIQTEPKNQEK